MKTICVAIMLLILVASPALADIIVVLNSYGVLVTAYKDVTVTKVMQNHPPSAGFRYWAIRDSCRHNKPSGGWNLKINALTVKTIGDSLHHANVDSVLMYDARINLGSW